MSASLTSITRQVSQMFDLNRRNLVQYPPLKHFFKIRVQIVLTFRIFRVYYYTIKRHGRIDDESDVTCFLCNRKFLGIPYYTKRH